MSSDDLDPTLQGAYLAAHASTTHRHRNLTGSSPALPSNNPHSGIPSTFLLSIFLPLALTALTSPPVLRILHHWLTRLHRVLSLLLLFPLLIVFPALATNAYASLTALLLTLGEAGAYLLLWSPVALHWAVWVFWAVVAYVVRGVRQVVGEIARFWCEVLGSCWPALVVAGCGWVLFSLAREVDYEQVMDETMEVGLLAGAGMVYRVGDVVRDLARVLKVE